MRNAVFCCVSKNYRDVVLPLLFSIKDNFDGEVFVGVIGEVSLEEITFIKKVPIDIELLKLPNETDYPDEAMWSMGSRFLVHDYLRNLGYEKILYIDCDTLVCRSLTFLFNVPIPDGTIGAVCEYNSKYPIEKYMQFDIREFDRRLELRRGLTNYFNSGVVIFNNTPLLFDDYKAEVIKNPGRYRFPDQDYLNERFIDFVELPREYNYFAELYIYQHLPISELLMAKKRGYQATILHYHCFCKPWSDIFSFSDNAISYQIPVVPYYIRALSMGVDIHQDLKDTYEENLEIQNTESEELIRQDALLEMI